MLRCWIFILRARQRGCKQPTCLFSPRWYLQRERKACAQSLTLGIALAADSPDLALTTWSQHHFQEVWHRLFSWKSATETMCSLQTDVFFLWITSLRLLIWAGSTNTPRSHPVPSVCAGCGAQGDMSCTSQPPSEEHSAGSSAVQQAQCVSPRQSGGTRRPRAPGGCPTPLLEGKQPNRVGWASEHGQSLQLLEELWPCQATSALYLVCSYSVQKVSVWSRAVRKQLGWEQQGWAVLVPISQALSPADSSLGICHKEH